MKFKSKTSNLIILFIVLLVAGIVTFGCTSNDSGTDPAPAPTATPTEVVVQFQQGLNGYTEAADAYIGSSTADFSFGGCSFMYIGPEVDTRRIVMYFSMTTVATNATVMDAKLYLRPTVSVGSVTINAYALTAGFDEGNVCSLQGYDFVEWNNRDSNAWTTPGGDYNVSTTIATEFYVHEAAAVVVQMDVATVQGWVNTPGSNYGFILIADLEDTGTHYASIASATGSQTLRPRLEVTYK